MSELAALPRPPAGQINIAVAPNTRMIDTAPSEAELLALGWTASQYSRAFGYFGPRAVISAWSGGAYSAAKRWMIVKGGGHTATGWNMAAAFDLTTWQWRRLTNPSRYVNNNGSPYDDGTPPASHSYSHLLVNPDAQHLIDGDLSVFTFRGTGYPDAPGSRGLFSWLPLDELDLEDPEGNLAAWQVYFPSGDPEAGAAQAPGYENTRGLWDPDGGGSGIGRLLYACPSKAPRSIPNYQAKSDPWEVYSSEPARGRQTCINTNLGEMWTTWGEQGGSMQLQVGDLSNYAASGTIPHRFQPCGGDIPRVNGLDGFAAGAIGADNIAERYDQHTAFEYDSLNGRALYWRPLYIDRQYHQDGVYLTDEHKLHANHQFWEVRDDYSIRKLVVAPNADGVVMPTHISSSDPQQNSGGPYNRLRYIEELDVFVYVSSAHTDVIFLKLPDPV